MASSIRTEGLTKNFGDHRAVDGLSVDLPQGGVLGFVGPNGAGKSTTIRMLLGLIRPTSGEAEVLGHSIHGPGTYLPRVGAFIEAPAFYPGLTGEENLRTLATLGGHPRQRISELLELVGLDERGGDRYKQYSLGMKQRLAIAAALLPDPDLLILDEPTNGLDPEGILEIRTLMMRLGAAGKTVFTSSHLLAEIQAACDWIVMIDHGGLLFSGALSELLSMALPKIRAAAEHPADTAALIRLATDAGYHTTRVNGAIEIEAPVEWTVELNRLAWAENIVLRELRAASADLEQAFFSMTGNNERVTS